MRSANLKLSEVDMRDAFFDELYNLAKNDSQVILLTADMGAHSLIKFKQDLPKQYFNVGIAEQSMINIAAGLALGGKKVFVYTIIPFAVLRCYEQIKIDLCCMNLPVTIIGVGPGLSYGSDGPTHHATSDIAVMRVLPEITILNPSDPVVMKGSVNIAYKNSGPTYVRIDKGKLPPIYDENINDFSEGLAELSKGNDLTIIASGIMVHQAKAVAKELDKCRVSAGVVDLYRIKPLNENMLLEIIDSSRRLLTLEENTIAGSIGSIISEFLNDSGRNVPLRRIALPDEHCFKSGSRESLQALYGLDIENVTKKILEWMKLRVSNGFEN